MSDSLSRLILRAQGRLPVAEPVLVSRYADGPSEAAWGETINETIVEAQSAMPALPGSRQTSVEIAHGRIAPSRDATSRSPDNAQPSASDVALPVEQAEPAEAATALPRQLPQALPNQRQFITLTPTAEAATGVGTDVVPAQVQARPQAALRRERLPPGTAPLGEPASRYEPVQVHSEKRASSRRPPPGAIADSLRVEPAVAAAPEVRISIGRVEVHAATPPVVPAAPARPAAPRRPTVSLADYLAERSRAG